VTAETLTPADRERLAAFRAAEELSDLVALTGTADEHEAYFEAKAEWYDLRGRELASSPPPEGLPGTTVTVDGQGVHVHGVTHADTPEERERLRRHVGSWVENIDTLSTRFREAAFSLVDAGSTVYGDAFEDVLGDIASALFTSHEQLATGRDFEAFRLSRAAAADPDLLADLQRYYARRFLPQPVEREWLRRHDPELELA
jgi:hypothetical protein